MASPSTVSFANGAALGTSPPTPVTPGVANDDNGIVNLGSGTAPSAGVFCIITLGGNYTYNADQSNQLRPQIQPLNTATQALSIFISAWSSRSITISCAVAPGVSQAVGTYQISYRT